MTDRIELDPRRLLGVRIILDRSSPDGGSARVGAKVGDKPTVTGQGLLSAKVGTKLGTKFGEKPTQPH